MVKGAFTARQNFSAISAPHDLTGILYGGPSKRVTSCERHIKKTEFKRSMPREAEPSLSERTFVSKALEEGLRLDNRKFDQFRPVELTFGDEFGVADVKLGKTRYDPFTSTIQLVNA